jgi:DNA-directed RNA polymerase specialized sigma24 family protein
LGFRQPGSIENPSVDIGRRMSMSQALSPHLPHLRRYAMALTGSQFSGDAHVRAALTALLAGDQSLMERVPARVGLYRLFHAIWQSGAENFDEAARSTSRRCPDECLRSLSANRRAALLLTAVEGFSLAEAALIVDESPEEVGHAILEAQKLIASQLAGRVLIIMEPVIVRPAQDTFSPALATRPTSQPSTKLMIESHHASVTAHEVRSRKRDENQRRPVR